ncbi:terminase large subunit, partial [Escherichia coli]
GYNIEGPCYDKRREVIEMLEGIVPNDELFGIIYTIDDGDDWTKNFPRLFLCCGPGIHFSAKFIIAGKHIQTNASRHC